ncbi:ATP-binding cassette subfamily F protein uup [Roseivirga ehrenbergii]|uniref:ABC transporter n=1 Tax=Roseivirga ehrenbergii (strain DSM 102268 / JCM 13514 / KCTC 12282 / NCIMB 14502 / KMM 6017) TaxID=279360 RepID=A0A150XP81_ROSEK|nr:ABC-F family ATP-binding cassette domain-containing protein [Roseivirga ehrenbergii]KYG80526.1 ABC transporter [Roseivirga ehrenbergii]TCL07768.1 ATP-binding cassette subfamily F protein uup [Roseivirga ehrenbergii]
MNYLSLENITKTFGDRKILDAISIGVDQGQKIALVGVNGSGKSTLLKIITGVEKQDAGDVVFRNDIVVRSLVQNPKFETNQTVLDAVFDSDDEALRLLSRYQKVMMQAERSDYDDKEMQTVIERIDALNAWDQESQVKQVLGKLGLKDLEADVSKLSGGQQKRVAMAQVLIQRPDLLILDEPTNHLDIDSIEWLEGYLSQANMALILVTHDRYFLEKVTNEIVELDHGKLYRYKGDYGHFLEKKAERHESEASSIEKAQNLYRKELDWIRRQPKARGTKAKYRVDAFEETKSKAFSGAKTTGMELGATASRQGKKVLEIEKISHGFGDKKLINNFSYVFPRKDRVGIVGANGSGKTTFLRLLVGDLEANEGLIDLGQTTKIGYYRQQELRFNDAQTVIEFAKEIAEFVEYGKGQSIPVSQFLTRFLFPPEVQYKPIGKLSGGEKRRLQLLKILIKSPNFLILDEPTNDLDLITLNTLENFLENFEGCLVLVSHDRYFVDKLVDHLFVFDGQGDIRDYNGNYTDWRLEEVAAKEAPKPKVIEKPAAPAPKKEQRKISYKEKLEFDTLEKEMAQLEAQKAVLNEKIIGGSTNHEELTAWATELERINNDLEEKEMRWLELSEYM